MHNVLFIAGLSNGETITEEKGNFQTITGELSPWQRLQKYIQEKGVTITSLSLYTKDGKRWNIPSNGNNPKFKAFGDAPKPISYKFYRRMGADVINNGGLKDEEIYAVVEAEYESVKIQVWVNDKSFVSWSFIK